MKRLYGSIGIGAELKFAHFCVHWSIKLLNYAFFIECELCCTVVYVCKYGQLHSNGSDNNY